MLLSALLFTCLGGCGAPTPVADPNEFTTVEREVNDQEFQKQNLPIRTLRAVVYIEEDASEETIRDAILDASQLLERQVGVVLAVVEVKKIKWLAPSFGGVNRDLSELRNQHPQADILIGVVFSFTDFLEACDHGDPRNCVVGETHEWRNIVLHSLTREVIAHEIGHTLLWRKWLHSPGGLMTLMHENPYLSIADRERILRLKWRDYHKKPAWFDW